MPRPHPGTLPALALLVALLAGLAPTPAVAGPPDEGECPLVSGAPGGDEDEVAQDAAPTLLKEGMQLEIDDLLLLRELLPDKVWQHREVFFHEGMRMEIGACHRRYPALRPYREATRKFRGQARLDEEGNLKGYTAGLPFLPPDIRGRDRDAATRWAWNLALRYRGAGHRGKFRLVDIRRDAESTMTFEGKWFFVQTSRRADLPLSRYAVEDNEDVLFAAGGNFVKPFDARHLAWRQFRDEETLEDYDEPDDTFVYVPSMRKARRAAATWIDGLYLPSYMASGDHGGGGMAFGAEAGGGSGGINPTAGLSIAVSEDRGQGMTGLVIRPNAYVWRHRGERVVLAPLNATRFGYPVEPKRNYGISGLSVASDRWDVRYAVVIEGAVRKRDQDIRTVEIWIDWQTAHPLYWITRTSKRRIADIGILVHRFTSDISGYPEWPGGMQANVLEPVAAVFYDNLGGGGWRRESYDVMSTPFARGDLREMTTSDELGRGR